MHAGEKYPLEQVATIKQKKLEEAEKALKEKKELLVKEEEKLTVVEAERNKVRDHRKSKLTQLRENLDKGTSTDKIQQMKHYLKVVDEQLKIKEQKVKEQLKHVEAAKQAVEAARENYIKKQQDVEKLKMHRHEWDKEMKAHLLHEESVEGDELGSGHSRRKKRPHK